MSCLLHRDQRSGDAHGHPPVAAGIELDVTGRSAGVEATAAAPGSVEAGCHVHAAGAVGQAAARVGVAGQRLRGGVQSQATAGIDVVEQQVGVASLREVKAEQRGMVGRRDRCRDAVVEAHVVAVRAGAFVAAVERQGTFAAVSLRHATTGRWHHLEGLAVAHPRAGLMAQRKRLQLRTVLSVVLLVPAVQPVQRTGIGDRGPEVEPVRHRRGREIVATREGAVGLRTAGGQHPVGDARWLLPWHCVQANVINPAGDRCAVGTGPLQFDRHHAAALQRGHIAQPHRLARPLLRVQRLRVALRAGAEGHPMLVTRSAGRNPTAIVQQQVQRHIGRSHGVLADDLRQHQPRQGGIGLDGHVRLEQFAPHIATFTAVAQCVQAAVADIALGGVGRRGAIADHDLQCACGRFRSRLARLERALQSLCQHRHRGSRTGQGQGERKQGAAWIGQGHARVSRKGWRRA